MRKENNSRRRIDEKLSIR